MMERSRGTRSGGRPETRAFDPAAEQPMRHISINSTCSCIWYKHHFANVNFFVFIAVEFDGPYELVACNVHAHARP